MRLSQNDVLNGQGNEEKRLLKQPSLSMFGLAILVIGQILPQMDFSIVNVALDQIGVSLRIGATGLVLVVAFYALAFAIFLAAGGRLGDRYGRKRILLIGITGFFVASAICGLATDLITMLLGRSLQGAFGALLLPQILATIHATLKGKHHSRAVGIYTAVAGLSVAVGQILGGWIVSSDLFGLGWRLGFFVNLPLCVLVLGLAAFSLPETCAAEPKSLDVRGMILFAAFLLCLLLPLALGAEWHAMRWLLLGLPPTGIALWYVETGLEAVGGRPLLPPSLFRTPLVSVGFLAEASVTFCYSGFLFVTALCLQSEIGFTPLQSGNSFCSLGLMFFLGSLLSKHVENRRAFVLGSLLTILGFVACSWTLHAHGMALQVSQILAATGLVGLGNAFMLTSAFRIALSNVSQHHAGEASAVISTVQQGCFALGTALAGAIYNIFLKLGYSMAFGITIFVPCSLILIAILAVLSSRIKVNV